MGFEAILNVIWLLLGSIALVAVLGSVLKGRTPVLCCIGVGLVVTTLFPIISASDDVIRIHHLTQSSSSRPESSGTDNHKRTSDNLLRLYEAMESPLVVTPVVVSFTVVFIFLISPVRHIYAHQRTIASNGRAPPAVLV